MRILLATDGKAGSAGAVRLAATLSEDPGTRVDLLQVLEPLEPQGPPSARLLVTPEPGFAAQRSAAAEERLAAWLREFGEPTVNWPTTVRIGPVPSTIVQTAETTGAELVVLGTGRHDRRDRWFGTETALRVTQLSHVPVLAVPAGAAGRPRSVFCAIDFSDFARDAVTMAVQVCGQSAELHLAHVVRHRPYDVEAPDEAAMQQLRDHGHEQLEAWADGIAGVARTQVHLHVLDGEPASELLQLADRIGAELVAAGSHGLGFLGRLLLGSVSTRLLREATGSVLIAPPRERARELAGGSE